MARPKQISASPVPGAGTVFALRAIGLVLAARWAFSMSQMGYLSSLRAMTSSPWACVNLVLIFLLIVLPGRWVGFRTLLYKEVLRFWKVSFQTVAAPVLTALLYLLIFGHVLEDRVKVFDQLSYTAFLVPGLVMMSVLQNAFANSSSSLIQSKITGNLVFIMLPPLSHWEMFGAYVCASVIRGLAVGTGVLVVTTLFAHLHFAQPLWIIVFAVLGAAVLGTLGLIAGIWAEKFDQLAAFQNFLIVPATFLAGVFYSIHSLPPFWQAVSHANPFFYMIDGFRYGFFGVSDVPVATSLGVMLIALVVVGGIALQMLRTGYKLRH